MNTFRPLLLLIATLTVYSTVAFATNENAANETTDKLTLALDADLSAVAVEGGFAIREGMEIAIDEINQQGGVLGKQLELVLRDHRGNPARGVRNIENLADHKQLLAIFGGVHTPVALAELEKIHQHNLLFMIPWAAGTTIVDNNFTPNNVFRVSIRDQEAGQVLIRHASERNIKRVALVLERTGWGRSNQSSLSKAAGEYGLNIVNTQWINWRQDNFDTEVQSIIESGAEAIILVANAPESAVVAKTLIAKQAVNLPVIAHWGLAGGDFVALTGLENLSQLDISVIQTFSFLQQKNTKATYLFNEYQRRNGETTESAVPAVVGVAHSYDLVHLLAKATEQAGTTDPDKIRHALENLPPLEGAVKRYAPAFSPSFHDALLAEDYFMTTFNENGHLVPLSAQP